MLRAAQMRVYIFDMSLLIIAHYLLLRAIDGWAVETTSMRASSKSGEFFLASRRTYR
jgi:hypothetical protein